MSGRGDGRGRGRGGGGGSGRDGNDGGGRGRGGGGGGGGRGGGTPAASSAISNPTEGIANILHVSLTPNFKFYQYSVDFADKDGKLIDSRSTRFRLFNTYFLSTTNGYLVKKLNFTAKEVEDIRRVIFFEGSFFFSARPISGLTTFPCIIVGNKQNDNTYAVSTEGVQITIVDMVTYTAPVDFDSKSTGMASLTQTSQQGQTLNISMDRRCSECTKAFVNLEALMSHCSITGHAPEYQQDTASKASTPALLLSYCNTALKYAMDERMIRWGRAYVERKPGKEATDKFGKGLGVEIHRAYYCEFGCHKPHNQPASLSLTVDLCAKIMRTKSLLHHICDGQDPKSVRSIDANKQKRFKSDLIGEVVICTYDKKCYSIVDLLFDKTPANHMITSKNISHQEYFSKQRNIQLIYPNSSPMVAVLGRNQQVIYLPPELVCINDLDPAVKQKLPLLASFSPKDRNEAIEEIKRFLIPGAQKTKGVGGNFLPAIGIYIQPQRVKIAVEVLPLPAIIAGGIPIPRDKGDSWAPILFKADYKVNPGQAVKLNVVLVYHRSIKRNFRGVYDRIRDFVNKFNATYRLADSPHAIVEAGDNQEHWGAIERHFASKQPSNLFLIDLCRPARGQSFDPAYCVIKHLLAKSGYLSQFVNFVTYDHGEPSDQRKSDTILFGVARQILTKCGFRVWWVNIPKEIPLPAVFIGIDVFHAPRKYDSTMKRKVAKESVAAIIVQVIRSYDSKANSKLEMYSQTFRRSVGQEIELGTSLQQTVENSLKLLNVVPKSCIVWRDGVGDTGISQVSADEISSIRRALMSKKIVGVGDSSSASPPVSLAYMVVQKRIATKLFSNDGESLPCGSLVTSLQGTEHATFYLQGTAPRFSTPRPARFIIVHMDPGLGSKKKVLAELSWSLCHEYANWAGPIKVPAPVQLAHKLAELAGNFSDNGETINASAYANKPYFL